MIQLSQLKNTSRPEKNSRRVGRGPGCKRGKTCGRGSKGDKSRRGYDHRYGYEGGQVPLYRKLPVRGFTRGRFEKATKEITLARINQSFADNEKVNFETLREKGLIPRELPGGYKIIATGDIDKKLIIEAHAISEGARNKLEAKSIEFKLIEA